MKKQNYVKPEVTALAITHAGVICASVKISEEKVDTMGRTSEYKNNGWNSKMWEE